MQPITSPDVEHVEAPHPMLNGEGYVVHCGCVLHCAAVVHAAHATEASDDATRTRMKRPQGLPRDIPAAPFFLRFFATFKQQNSPHLTYIML